VVARSQEQLRTVVEGILRDRGRAAAYPADVSRLDEVERVRESLEGDFGPVDLLVSAAGVMAPVGPDWEVNPQQWWRTLEVNIRGAFNCSRTVLPGMLSRGGGRIVNISSSAAYNFQPFTSAYGISKAALTYHTTCLARSAGPFGVKVFAFAPGFVRTEMTQNLASSPEGRHWLGGLGRALADGHVTPIERVLDVFFLLISGGADFLAGRHIDARDDLDAVLAARDVIEREDLLVLRRSTLADV
jgi:NAD(P)-dependent dehydrogenase (short-subunit alcohol dehydrogenase family)